MRMSSCVWSVVGLLSLMLPGCLKYEPAQASTPPPRRAEATAAAAPAAADTQKADLAPPSVPHADEQLPNRAVMKPLDEQIPITFVNRTQNAAEWEKLAGFWNQATEKVRTAAGAEVERPVVKIKVPLGLTSNPPVPDENPLTVMKWTLGKKLYFDPILSTGNISCATCHDPAKGFTDQMPVSTGILSRQGGVSAPTVVNSGYHLLQFWDGRAASLEAQAQGPVQNPAEMFGMDGVAPDVHAWPRAVARMRENAEYVALFKAVFGTEPTRDGAAKAIAAYERTVLAADSVHDRAELAMRARVADEGTTNFTVNAKDYEAVLTAMLAEKDKHQHQLGVLDLAAADAAKVKKTAEEIALGRTVYFGKARCNTCHGGDNFTDNQFHNLGVGAKDGVIQKGHEGRYAAQSLGHKNPLHFGAQKTPTVRNVTATGPYMHDGSEKTLEAVVEFYDRGGNANEYLDINMRDVAKEAELAQLGEEKFKAKYPGVEVVFCGPHRVPVIPLKLNLTKEEKAGLVAFMKALTSPPFDPSIADPKFFPTPTK